MVETAFFKNEAESLTDQDVSPRLCQLPDNSALILGIAPVMFSGKTFRCGRLDPKKHGPVKELRHKYGKTHAFRFDTRDQLIANVGLWPGVEPMGDIDEEAKVAKNLLLLAEAIHHQFRWWLSGNRTILRHSRPLVCLGRRDQLLRKSLCKLGIKKSDSRLDVVAKWSFDFRLITPAHPDEVPWLGLIADVGTSNVINIPVAELLTRGFDPRGCYVGIQDNSEDGVVNQGIRLLGQVTVIEKGQLFLTDLQEGMDNDQVRACNVFLEPRRENLEAVIRIFYPSVADQALAKLRQIRAPYISGDGKLEKIRQTLESFKNSLTKDSEKTLKLILGDGLSASLGTLLDQNSPHFPHVIETARPTMLFGPNGHNRADYPDVGIKRYGPFQYTHNPINEPTIAILCDKRFRGRMEQFAKSLQDGLYDGTGRYEGGLIGKFRLTNARLQFAEIHSDTAEGYSSTVDRVLDNLPRRPNLALVQIKEEHRKRSARQNPYFVAKAHFMRAGVPVQAVRLETVESPDQSKAYALNQLALASYAKIGGIPWVISTRAVASHELVIGIGCTAIGNSRLGEKTRYIGITTLFQGDGRYLVWETTQEATFENYPEILLASLQRSIRFVREQNRWEPGDPVRLIFHVYKPLKRKEIGAAKGLVDELLKKHPVEFAFLDLSHQHPFQIFDTAQNGNEYWSREDRRKRTKGTFVPRRGAALLIGPRTALLQLVGAGEVKTWDQGLPCPLLLELHPDSDFSDLTYLVRQVFHFSFMSWRSFFPANEPVTVLYSRWIANLLGNLRAIPGWDPAVLAGMRDRRAMWFL